MQGRRVRLFFSVGEASADIHTANVCRALKQHDPDMELVGFGGDHCRREGMEILYPLPDLALIGFVEVIKHLPQVYHVKQLALQSWTRNRPDAIVMVDYPGFNLRMAKIAHQMGIPVLYFIAPQVWAWHEERVEQMREHLQHLFVIFPFEEAFFSTRGIQTTFVGHPLLERLPDPTPLPDDLPALLEAPRIGLLPGSRRNEIRNLLPVMLTAAARLRETRPSATFVLPLSSALPDDALGGFDVPSWVEVVRDPDYTHRRNMTLAWTKSGTSTVENALLQIPMAVLYRSSWLNAWLARRYVRVPYIGMVNLIAQKGICPEFIQEQFQPEPLLRFTEELLSSPERYKDMKNDLRIVRERLGRETASTRTAGAILDVLNTHSPRQVSD